MARTEATRKLWDYIKAHGLQDAANKRMINADDKLKAVFNGKALGVHVRNDQAGKYASTCQVGSGALLSSADSSNSRALSRTGRHGSK